MDNLIDSHSSKRDTVARCDVISPLPPGVTIQQTTPLCITSDAIYCFYLAKPSPLEPSKGSFSPLPPAIYNSCNWCFLVMLFISCLGDGSNSTIPLLIFTSWCSQPFPFDAFLRFWLDRQPHLVWIKHWIFFLRNEMILVLIFTCVLLVCRLAHTWCFCPRAQMLPHEQ